MGDREPGDGGTGPLPVVGAAAADAGSVDAGSSGPGKGDGGADPTADGTGDAGKGGAVATPGTGASPAGGGADPEETGGDPEHPDGTGGDPGEGGEPADPVLAAHEAEHRYRRHLAEIVLAVFALYSLYAWLRHRLYLTTGYDLGIFDQVVRDYSRFQAPLVPLKAPDYNLLGDHFHPVLVLLAPLYWIWDDPRMLLLAQAALFAVSMVPVARFVRRRWGATRALWVAAAYGLSWPLQRAVAFDMHEIAFAVPLLAGIIDALDRRADRTTVLLCLALLTVREDMGSVVAIAGLLVAFRRRRPGYLARPAGASDGDVAGDVAGASGGRRLSPERRRSLVLGGSLVVLGVVVYRLATGVVIPHFAQDGEFAYWTFTGLGPDLHSAAVFSLTHPWEVVKLFVSPEMKADTLLALAIPTAFLCLGSPYFLLTVPFLAERFLNDREQLWETTFHYSSVSAPILTLAAVAAVDALVHRTPAARLDAPTVLRWVRDTWARRPLEALDRARGRRVRPLADLWIVWAVGCVTFGMVFHTINYPVSQVVYRYMWVSNSRTVAAADVLAMIPDDVCVEASNQLSPHLTDRTYVTQVGASEGLATYLVLDTSQADTGWLTPTTQSAIWSAPSRGFEEIAREGVIRLYHRDGEIDERCVVS